MQNPVADILTMLLHEGRQRGLPMRPSGGLQRQLANMKTSTPDIASVMEPNVEVLPGPDMRQFGTPMPKDIWYEMIGQDTPFNTPLSRSDPTYHPSHGDVVPEAPTPISSDEWFNRGQEGQIRTPMDDIADSSSTGWPPGTENFQSRPGDGEVVPIRPLDMVDPSATGRARSDAMTSGPLVIWATSKNGKAVRLDGPFNSQIEALRALANLEKEIRASNPSAFSSMSLSIGPDRE